MNDQHHSDPMPFTRASIWQMTLAFPLLLWCVGFLGSLMCGCGIGQAVPKATAYTISGLVGWLVYLFARRPSHLSFEVGFVGWNGPMTLNLALLNPTRTPWPFPEMLASGLIRSALGMALMGLLFRLLKRGKSPLTSEAHPPNSR